MYIEKKGSKYWGCCPFHREKTPSFIINPDEQYYHCFSCNVSGNVITFLMEHEGMAYPDALEFLANLAGYPLPDDETEEQKRKRQMREKAFEILRFTAKYYFDNLKTEDGLVALRYLQGRQIDIQTIKEFGIGYSKDYTSLVEELKEKGYSKESMLYAGVVSQSDSALIDFEGKRVTIPIINAKGQVIAFGGRTLDDTNRNKYKNTSATALFDKKRTIFGLNLIKKNQKALDFKNLILVEGYMDVIALYQAGIKNVVACMGTSLTEYQCRELKKWTNLIYVCFDGDSAGQKATWRSLDLLNIAGIEVRVVSLPDGLDPDDTVKKYGREGYIEILHKALPLIEFKIRSLAKIYDIETLNGKSKFANATLEVFSNLEPIERDAYIKLVSDISSLSEESIKNSLRDYKPVKAAEKMADESAIPEDALITPEDRAKVLAARFILSAFINNASFVMLEHINSDFFIYPAHKNIYEYIMDCLSQKKQARIGDLFDVVGKAQNEVDKILNAYSEIPDDKLLQHYNECVKLLNRSIADKTREELVKKINEEPDIEQKELLKEQLRKLIMNSNRKHI